MNLLRSLPLTISLLSSTSAYAFNTPQLMQSALSPSCLEYKITGICYWLLITPFGCQLRTSIRVKHYIPDLVISSYANTGQNPWREVAFLGSPVSGTAEGGGDTNARPGNEKTKIKFKNVDTIGHPASQTIFQFMSGSSYSCKGSAVAFKPYFVSTRDVLGWRKGLPESFYPEALIPGKREVGQLGDLWGNMFPRAGALSHTHDYKAAAVIAQRAADIVTRTGQPHVYLPLKKSHSKGYWPPPPVHEGKRTTHKWQMLAPRMDKSCTVFPHGTPLSTHSDRLAEDGAYSWALWRPYSCCKRRGQVFLGSSNS